MTHRALLVETPHRRTPRTPLWALPLCALLLVGCQAESPAARSGAAAVTEVDRAEIAADLPRRPMVADPDDWCSPHALPESMCTKCNPSLRPRFKAAGDYCAEHRLPKSACPQCDPVEPPPAGTVRGSHPGDLPRRPKVADPDDWCAGHGVPESMCTKCNPSLEPRFKAAGDFCAGHGLPESVCPDCNPLAPPKAQAAVAADLPQRPAVADPADWCTPHRLPESMCTLCNPSLKPRYEAAGDFCAGHGLPESVCPDCNPLAPPEAKAAVAADLPQRPAVADPADWCTPHRLPESMCTLCNPSLKPRYEAAGDFCAGHGLPESVCPDCNPLAPPANPPAHGPTGTAGGEIGAGHSVIRAGTRIRFKDPAIAAAAGISTVPAVRSGLDARIDAPARLDHDRNRMADVRAPIAGIVRSVEVDLGATVEAGQPLFTLESARIGDLQARKRAARARLETARADVRRQTSLAANAIASERQVQAARREASEASAELRAIEANLRLGGAEGGTGRYVVRAPIDGAVIRRPALLGTYADETVSLATLADRAHKWALVDVPESQASALRPGQRVELTVTGQPGTFSGTIDVIAAEIDPHTRAVSARVIVPDPEGRLRAGAYARASIVLEGALDALTVPVAAVQQVGEERVVFIRTGAGVYTPKVVTPGRSDGRRIQITGEVAVAAPVVVDGAFLLRTELMRDAIGAGCCEVEGPGE